MKKYRFLLLSLVGMLVLSGCAPTVTKLEKYPKMYQENPTSILVIPAINQTTAADAPQLYSSTVNQPLANAGFYVLPMEVTDRFLIDQGLTDGGQIKDVPPQKFAEIFGADAILYATINNWDTAYYVVGGSVKVGIHFELVSCKTGETLWEKEYYKEIDTTVDGGHAVLSVILTAVKTASTEYVPIAYQVNREALISIPYGEYHRLYNQDQGQEVLDD